MIAARFVPVALKQVWRHRTRSALTVAGVAVAMFLFVAVETLQRAVHEATSEAAAESTLIVYRENRFCPATSRLPEYYGDRIARISGVASVVPMKVVVNNCRANLDVITFRGLRDDDLSAMKAGGGWELVEGSEAEWQKRSDAALVGERLAARGGYKVGQSFVAAGVNVNVAGIVRSDQPQDQNVAYVHLEFLQRAAGGGGLGVVTQFFVKVSDPARAHDVASAIDEEFRTESEPTTTRSEKAFLAQAGADIVQIVGFTAYLGWGCLAAVLALVANSIVLSVQDRIKEHAVLQTLGYRAGLIARLIISEGVIIGLAGGALGTLIATAFVKYGKFTLATEGLSINITPDARVVAMGLVISAGVGVLAGLVPALQAGRREIAACFRAV